MYGTAAANIIWASTHRMALCRRCKLPVFPRSSRLGGSGCWRVEFSITPPKDGVVVEHADAVLRAPVILSDSSKYAPGCDTFNMTGSHLLSNADCRRECA